MFSLIELLFIIPLLVMGWLVDFDNGDRASDETANEHGGIKATAVFVVTLVVYFYFFTSHNPLGMWEWVRTNGWIIGLGAVAYVLIGAVWGPIVKWYFYTGRVADAINTRWESFEESYGKYDSIPAKAERDYNKSLKDNPNRSEYRNLFQKSVWSKLTDNEDDLSIVYPTLASKQDLILWWMTFWPMSMAWTVLDNPVRKVMLMAFDSMTGVMTRIMQKQFSRIHR